MRTIDLAALVGCETGRAVIVVPRGRGYVEVRVPSSRIGAVAERLREHLPIGVTVDIKSLGHEEQYTHRIILIDNANSRNFR